MFAKLATQIKKQKIQQKLKYELKPNQQLII